MAPTNNDNKTKTAKEEDTRQGNPSQQSLSAVTSLFNAAAHGVTRAVASRPSSATPSTPATHSDDHPKPILEALNQKLPVFPSGKGSNFTDTTYFSISDATGQSTKLAKPPMAWIAEDMDSFLKTYFTDEIAKISVPGMAPHLEKSFRISNEADVVRASAVYLLNVVNIAAQAWLGDEYDLICTAETHSADTITDTETIITRTDVEWTLETKLGEPKKVAIMEYKRKHLIDPKQLLKARYNQEDLGQFKEDVRNWGGEKTNFTGTAFWLIKQVKGYHKSRRVRDICLFDWDTIFILDFENVFDPDAQKSSEEDKDKGKSPQGVPAPKNDADIDKYWPTGILYQERPPEGAAEEHSFRCLLLAFLIRALKRVKKETSVPVTYDESPPPPSHGEAGGVNPARSETPAETTGEQKTLPIRSQQGGKETRGQGVAPSRGERATGEVTETRGRGRGTTVRGRGTTRGRSKEVKEVDEGK